MTPHSCLEHLTKIFPIQKSLPFHSDHSSLAQSGVFSLLMKGMGKPAGRWFRTVGQKFVECKALNSLQNI